LKMSLLTAGGLGWMTSKDPFQPKAFYDSAKYSSWEERVPICFDTKARANSF